MGSMPFLTLHAVGFAAWFAVSLNAVPGVEPFDPFPYCSKRLMWTKS